MKLKDQALGEFEKAFVRALFFEIFDSIRYAKGNFDPHYKSLRHEVKLKTTEELQRISEAAADYYAQHMAAESVRDEDETRRKQLISEAIEEALKTGA
jgi:hypothetical protein